jgi:hypothetical protein
MAIDFSQVEAAIAATKSEVVEHEAAAVVLEEAKTALAVVQTQVAAAQAAVSEAAVNANTQKADVVNGINAAIVALNDLLAQLQ